MSTTETEAWQLQLFPLPEQEVVSVSVVTEVATRVVDALHVYVKDGEFQPYEFAVLAYQNAFAHGWYHDQKTGTLKPRDVAEILQNFEGEIKEFRVEVFRQKYDVYYNASGNVTSMKPEGAWIELADLLIRMADAIGYFLNDHPSVRFGAVDYAFIEEGMRAYVGSITEAMRRKEAIGGHSQRGLRYVADWLSAQVSILWEMYRRTTHENFIVGLWDTYVCVYEVLNREFPGKIVPAIMLKHEYNKGRPYRHGGLRA